MLDNLFILSEDHSFVGLFTHKRLDVHFGFLFPFMGRVAFPRLIFLWTVDKGVSYGTVYWVISLRPLMTIRRPAFSYFFFFDIKLLFRVAKFVFASNCFLFFLIPRYTRKLYGLLWKNLITVLKSVFEYRFTISSLIISILEYFDDNKILSSLFIHGNNGYRSFVITPLFFYGLEIH